MLSVLIGAAVIAAATAMIVRNYQPQAVLLVAGLILLAATAVLFPTMPSCIRMPNRPDGGDLTSLPSSRTR